MSWKELPDPEVPSYAEPSQTSRTSLIKRLCNKCFKLDQGCTSSTRPRTRTNVDNRSDAKKPKQERSRPFEPFRRESDSSLTSSSTSEDSHDSLESSGSTTSSSSFGPRGQGFEVPVVTVLDPAGDLIHGHGGSWGDFEEREAIGSGAGQIRTIREKMRARRPARPSIVIPTDSAGSAPTVAA